MIKVEVNKQVKSRVPFKLMEQGALQVNSVLKVKKKLTVTVAIVSEKVIKDLNKKYRKKDKVTDVLSFSEETSSAWVTPELIQGTAGETRDVSLGDVLICYKQAQRQATEKKHSIQKELLILFVHGLFHLFGYDHEKAKEAEIMEALEEKVLNKIYNE